MRNTRVRIAIVIAIIIVGGLAWWLGSPLFVRTTANEAAPTLDPRTTPVAGIRSDSPGPRVLAMGKLGYVDALHNGTGAVRILDTGAQRTLRFEDVAITNAPDVHVYLSRETGGKWTEATSLYLGPLKATNGSFNYEIPQTADVAAYRSVVVWCRAFAVLVSWADLAAP